MNNFYVYIYKDPFKNFEPFYVGKGCKGRFHDISSRKHNKHLYNKIQKLRRLGCKINDITFFERVDLLEEEALNLEISLIDKIGRFDKKRGPLLNLTDGGDGVKGIKNNPKLLPIKDEIIYLYTKQHKTLKDIASLYICGISSVLYILKFFDIPRRKPGVSLPNINFEQLKIDYQNGDSINKLQHKYSCDHKFIKKWLIQHGLDVTDGRSTSNNRGGRLVSCINKEIQKVIIEKFLQGKSRTILSREYNVDLSTIKRVLILNNIPQRDNRFNVFKK